MAKRQGHGDRSGRSPERPEDDRGVYIISVAAELAGVHPQTLRIYERKGLLRPARTAGNTRRYSERDIARLQMIQRLTQQFGINLAGVKMIVEMENQLDEMRERMEQLDRELSRARRRMREAVERGQRPTADLVPLSSVRRLLAELGLPQPERRVTHRRGERGPIPVGPAD